MLGVAFAGIVVHALPDMRAWARGEAPVGIHAPLEKCRGEAARHATLAARYAAVIVGCLNGGAITDGEQIVACMKPR